ncbi:MAG: RluA family pseudouridine synthase [Clostridia bacterium]|nr:RluA family pseudouridine synthase [Clostridia bacterium]
MEILFEDKELIVCVKERGILSQEGKAGEKTMLSLLSEITGEEIFPVHRLDKEVGGVMVFAKTRKSAAALSAQVTDRTMEKEYITVIEGSPAEKAGIMEDLLFFDRSKNKSFTVKKERRGVKKASLSYSVLSESDGLSLVRVKLHTGRTHQIRVQFASRKMPIVGDRRYGSKTESKNIALWSCYISFVHPTSGEKMTFEKMCDFQF